MEGFDGFELWLQHWIIIVQFLGDDICPFPLESEYILFNVFGLKWNKSKWLVHHALLIYCENANGCGSHQGTKGQNLYDIAGVNFSPNQDFKSLNQLPEGLFYKVSWQKQTKVEK